MAEIESNSAKTMETDDTPDKNPAPCEQKSIYDLISGDVYDGLKRTFLVSGKGRRPDPPTVPHTNRLLLMLHCLRLEGGKPVKDMTHWFEKLLGNVFPINRVSKRIERTVSKAIAMIGTPSLATFVNAPLNLHSISSSLDEVGIDWANVHDSSLWIKEPCESITNSVIVDLELFRSREKLKLKFVYEWVLRILGYEISPSLLDICKKTVDKTIVTYKELVKRNGTKKEKVTPFLEGTFNLNLQDANKPTVPLTLKHACIVCQEKTINVSNLKKENSLLKNRCESWEEKYESQAYELAITKERLAAAEDSCLKINNSLQECLTEMSGLKAKISDAKLWRGKVKSLNLSLKRSFNTNHKLKQDILKMQKSASSLRSQLQKQKLKRKKAILELECNKDYEVDKYNNEIKLKGSCKNVYVDKLRTTVIALACEAGVAAANVSKVISIVAKGIFDFEFKEPLPCKQTVLNIVDEGHVLSNIQVVEHVMESSDVTLHTDGTSRDQKKIVGYQFSLGTGEQFYLGYLPVASEDSNTLLDITLNLLKKLSVCYGAVTSDSTEIVFKKILSKITSIMTDRAAVMKLFDSKFLSYLKTEIGTHFHVHFLHCNAHFLLGISSGCEKALIFYEKNIFSSTGQRLGRDKQQAKFSHFSSSESSVSRLLRTLWDILGPRGDQKNGCRTDWTTFCENSIIPCFKSNRFNCFFEAASAIIYHHHILMRFFTCGVLPDNLNLKIQSVSLDVQDAVLMNIVCVIALFHLKVTGPYWVLVNSQVKYVDFHKYVQKLIFYLEKWSQDPADLFESSFQCVFSPDISFQSVAFSEVHAFVLKSDISILKEIAMELSEEISNVTKRQLSDFIDGSYANEADPETAAVLEHCPLTNLIGESAFGDLDFDFSKRRNASFFNRSSVHAVKRNRTVAFIENKPPSDKKKLFSIARRLGPAQRVESKKHEKCVKDAIREKFLNNQEKKIQRQLMEIERNAKSMENVKKHGGPCHTSKDVDDLMEKLEIDEVSHKEKEEVIKNEIRLINATTGRRCLKFGSLEFMVASLKGYLHRR